MAPNLSSSKFKQNQSTHSLLTTNDNTHILPNIRKVKLEILDETYYLLFLENDFVFVNTTDLDLLFLRYKISSNSNENEHLERLPSTTLFDRERSIQELIWMKHHDKIDSDVTVVNKNGIRQDCRLTNLEVIKKRYVSLFLSSIRPSVEILENLHKNGTLERALYILHYINLNENFLKFSNNYPYPPNCNFHLCSNKTDNTSIYCSSQCLQLAIAILNI